MGKSQPKNSNNRFRPDDGEPPYGWIHLLSLGIVVSCIVALELAWYTGALYITPSGGATSVESYHLFVRNIKLKDGTTRQVKDYDQVAVPDTNTIIQLCRAWTGIALALSLTLWISSGLASFQELRKALNGYKFTRNIFRYYWFLVGATLVFSVLAVLTLLGMSNAMQEDDIVLQLLSATAVRTCDSSIVDCSSFWSSNTQVIGGNTEKEEHKPGGAWWAMIVASALSFLMLFYYMASRAFLRLDYNGDDDIERQERKSHD